MSDRSSGERVRIGCVRYLNTLPLIEGLEKAEGVTLIPAAPSLLSGLLDRGEADVALASLIDAQRASSRVALLPAGVIGCDGPTLTVRLYSAVPIDRIVRVHADAESHTARALLRILLRRRWGIDPQQVDFDARELVEERGGEGVEWPEAALLIGDKVVTGSPPAVRYPHQIDLGEAWKELTGLPFVYAAWMCREKEAGSERVQRAVMLLDRQRRHNATRLDWLAARRGPERGWPVDLARRYLTELLRFDADARSREAVEAFFDAAHEEGLLAERRAVRWTDQAPVPACRG